MGRAAPVVLGDEVVDDVALELALEVEEVVGDSQRVAHAAGVLYVFDGAAALACCGDVLSLDRPKAHGYADHVESLAVRSSAATEESTPPLMATMTFVLLMD